MAPYRRKPTLQWTTKAILILCLCFSKSYAKDNELALNPSNNSISLYTNLDEKQTTTSRISTAMPAVTAINEYFIDVNNVTEIPKTYTNNPATNQTFPSTTDNPSIQDSCVGYQQLSVQPIYSDYAQVTKCTENDSLVISFAWAVFYENCVDDLGNATSLPNEIFNPCASATHNSFVYGDDEDRLFVLQNGSLFRTNFNYTEYDVFETYCFFADKVTGQTMALVCYDGLVTVSRAQAYLYAICKFSI